MTRGNGNLAHDGSAYHDARHEPKVHHLKISARTLITMINEAELNVDRCLKEILALTGVERETLLRVAHKELALKLPALDGSGGMEITVQERQVFEVHGEGDVCVFVHGEAPYILIVIVGAYPAAPSAGAAGFHTYANVVPDVLEGTFHLLDAVKPKKNDSQGFVRPVERLDAVADLVVHDRAIDVS